MGVAGGLSGVSLTVLRRNGTRYERVENVHGWLPVTQADFGANKTGLPLSKAERTRSREASRWVSSFKTVGVQVPTVS